MNKLQLALAGTEHVKAYTKKDGTRVSAHTRDGEHAGHGTFQTPKATGLTYPDYDPDNPAHPKPKFTIGQTVAKGRGKKLWTVRAMRLTQWHDNPPRWQVAVKNYDTGKSSSLWHGEGELTPAEEGMDAREVGEAVKAVKEKLAVHKASVEAKASQKPAQGELTPVEGKVVKYSEKKPNPKHPAPELKLGTQPNGDRVVDRRLKLTADGSFVWEYLYAKQGEKAGWTRR